MAVPARQLSDGNDAGTVLGQSASDKLSFFGGTPVVQQAFIADATDATTALTKVAAIIDVLIAYNLIAAS